MLSLICFQYWVFYVGPFLVAIHTASRVAQEVMNAILWNVETLELFLSPAVILLFLIYSVGKAYTTNSTRSNQLFQWQRCRGMGKKMYLLVSYEFPRFVFIHSCFQIVESIVLTSTTTLSTYQLWTVFIRLDSSVHST